MLSLLAIVDPHANASSAAIYWFVDEMPAIALVFVGIAMLIRRDLARVAEMCWIEGIGMVRLCLFCIPLASELMHAVVRSLALLPQFADAIAHIVTTLPDARSDNPPCHDKQLGHLGSWIFLDITADYCGDVSLRTKAAFC